MDFIDRLFRRLIGLKVALVLGQEVATLAVFKILRRTDQPANCCARVAYRGVSAVATVHRQVSIAARPESVAMATQTTSVRAAVHETDGIEIPPRAKTPPPLRKKDRLERFRFKYMSFDTAPIP